MMKKIVISVIAWALFLAFLPAPSPALAQGTQSFFDIPATYPEYPVLENLKTMGIVQGRPDETFGPTDPITRAEALKLILKAAGLPAPVEPFHTSFTDVASDSWYIGYISEAEELGIIHGNPDGTFEPNRAINEAEFLKLLLTAANEDYANADVGTPEAPLAPDVAPDDWFAPYLSHAKAIELICPFMDGSLNPAETVTRVMGAVMIYKYYIIRNGSDMEILIDLADRHLDAAVAMLDENNLDMAFRLSNCATFYGALALKHNADSSGFSAAQDIAYALHEMIMATYQSSIGQIETAQAYAAEAETLADEAVANDSSRQELADKIHQLGDALLAP